MEKNLFKKVISIILVIAMMSTMAVYVSAASGTYVDEDAGLTYTYETDENDNNVASVKGSDNTITSVDIPATITVGDEVYTVTTLAYECFYNYADLAIVTLPSTLITIGEYAFQDCDSLTSITIPSSVTSIDKGAFFNCVNLKEVIFLEDSSLTIIDENAFYWCESLTSIDIPVGVTTIGATAFRECYALESVTIPSTVSEIGNYAFYLCTSLLAIEIPKNVTKLNESVLGLCSSLATVTLYNTIEYIALRNFDVSVEGKTIKYYGTQEQWEAFVAIVPDADLKVGFVDSQNSETGDIVGELIIEILGEDDENCECEDCEDTDDDGCCDLCGLLIIFLADYDFTNGGRCYWSCCECICNASTGLGQILGDICLFFWEFFGINKWCCCGRMHY